VSRHAVIMVPAEGKGAQQFFWSAQAVKTQVYKGNATIVKVRIELPTDYSYDRQLYHPFPVKFVTDGSQQFLLARHKGLGAFIIISHAGPADGPIFYDGRNNQYQPWTHVAVVYYDGKSDHFQVLARPGSHLMPEPRVGPRYRPDMLAQRAVKFWHLVGQCLAEEGKIILLGCNYGAETYLDKVALASHHKAFGPKTQIMAGDVKTAVAFINHIERGKPDDKTRGVSPIAAIGHILELSEIGLECALGPAHSNAMTPIAASSRKNPIRVRGAVPA
jgi:hypothetical protein